MTDVASSPVRNRLMQHAASATALRGPASPAAAGATAGTVRSRAAPGRPAQEAAGATARYDRDFIVQIKYIAVSIVSSARAVLLRRQEGRRP